VTGRPRRRLPRVEGGLAQGVTRALHRRWPGAEVSSTSAGVGRVQVSVPLAQARELCLAGRGASASGAAAAFGELLGRPVRVLEVRRPQPGAGRRYSALLELR
jgi:hypothetical protein